MCCEASDIPANSPEIDFIKTNPKIGTTMTPIRNDEYSPVFSVVTFILLVFFVILAVFGLSALAVGPELFQFYLIWTIVTTIISLILARAWWKQSDSHHVCSDCRGKISPKAKICPHCRAPAENH